MALSAGTRRTVACVLVGLGAALLVAALLIPTYTVSKVAKTPLDLEITTIAENQKGEESLVLDSKSLTSGEGAAVVNKDVPLISQRFVTVEEPSDADDMTLQAGQTLRRTDVQGDTGLLTAAIDRVTISRTTGMPVETNPNGSIAVTVDKEGSVMEPVQHTGIGYRFPIGTEKKTYPYFDINVRESFDANFIEETEINNMKVYHFQMTAPVTSTWDVVQSPTNRLTLPASKWGVEGGDTPVTMTRYYTNVRDLWVEPETGTVIKGGESIHLYYARSGDKPEVTALKSHLVFDEATVESQIAIAKENTDKLSLFGRVVPIVFGVLGVLALLAGLFLGLRGGGTPAHATPRRTRPTPAPTAAPDDSAATRWDGDDAPTTQFPRGDYDTPTEQIDIDKRP
ncbi:MULTISPECIES: DUF3068 domain-containing protein [Nocardia]|uniref:DUF3068 domain-containing protein n=1 Tax=Nocardia TaxID=1817 RepID=UPI0006FB684B|nr:MULTISPECIES: DUF3068 domain-containing protein [Nocardia]KQY28517.1 hypothetical protein ASD42_28060 [Nocardia sp. Root136]